MDLKVGGIEDGDDFETWSEHGIPPRSRCHWGVKEKLTGNPSLCFAGHDALDGNG